MRLQHKVIIITGSCTGIGRAIAERCVAEGGRVVVHGLDQQDLGEELVTKLGHDNATLYLEDITSDGAPQRLVNTALTSFGRLDGIVNNAAMIVTSNIHTTSLAFFRSILEVNTLAPFALIQAALPHLTESRGCVLNIGSANAWCGEPDLVPYSASKGALMTLTRNLGDTLHRENGVRVNQINPGWVLTEKEVIQKRNQGLAEGWSEQLPRTLAPAGRILRPDEIAAAAVYWLADESGPVSGQVLDLEQYPLIGRNPPKDADALPTVAAS